MQISYKRVKTCYKIKIGFRDLLGLFVGFGIVVDPIIYKKSLFSTPIQLLLEWKRGFFV